MQCSAVRTRSTIATVCNYGKAPTSPWLRYHYRDCAAELKVTFRYRNHLMRNVRSVRTCITPAANNPCPAELLAGCNPYKKFHAWQFYAWEFHIFMHEKFIFHAWDSFSCIEMKVLCMKMKISPLSFFMHDIFRKGTYPANCMYCFGACVQNWEI